MPVLLTIFIMLSMINVSFADFSIMQYNVQNLFDTVHDPNTEDYTYLPLALKRKLHNHLEYCNQLQSLSRKDLCLHLDWTEKLLSKKLNAIVEVIQSFQKDGPDILVLNEVENLNVLKDLANKLSEDYHLVLISGDDSRGINNAILSKFPVISARHHSIYLDGNKLDTRGILEVRLAYLKHEIIIFANHWPSQSNPTTERLAAAQTMHQLSLKTYADLIFAIGDFNVHNDEVPDPFALMQNFLDIENAAREASSPLLPGTHYKQGQWNSRDKIFWQKNSLFKIRPENYLIFARPFMLKTNPDGTHVPWPFDERSGSGYSDHLPIALRFSL